MRALILLTTASLSFGEVFCIQDVENNTNEPYLSYAVLKFVEKALLEAGNTISCEGEHEKVHVRIRDFRDTPIAYTSRQRVSSYNLHLSLEIRVGEKKITLGGAVPYTLPGGGYGDIPRRKAIDDLLDKIYWNALQNFRR